MSMLAERRRKQKWTLNPRGKYWTDDPNKIGQKMLEKMGWTSGKGLGVNEQGNTEYCRVPYKNNTSGIGYDNNPEEWIECQEGFETFLKQLHGTEDVAQKLETRDDELSEQSMELKSKKMHSRVHCQKLIRGKDLNSYKSKDLANIFGRKEFNDKIEADVEKNNTIYEKEIINTKNNRHGVVTINCGNMTDYFKSKLNSKLICDKTLASNMINNEVTDSESENERAGFGFVPKLEKALSTKSIILKDSEESNYAFDNPCLGLNSPVDSTFNTNGIFKKPGKQRKKAFENAGSYFDEMDKHNVRKKLKTGIIDSNCVNAFTNPALNLDTGSEENCNANGFEVCRAEFGLENCGLDLTDEESDKKRVTFNDHIMLYEYNTHSSKKTKKRKEEVTLDKFEVKNKKHKNKRKHESSTIPGSDGFINEALDIEILCDEINDNELNEYQSRKVKKRKICKISSLETILESPEQEKEVIDIETESTVITLENIKTNIEDQRSKKKKKKKKKKADPEEIIVIDTKNEESDIKIEEVRNKEIKNKEGEILNFKKYKKKKKKDKENCKIEWKHTIQTEITDKTDMLEQSNIKEISHSVRIDDKYTIEIEMPSLVRRTSSSEEQGDIKQKRKKKSIDKENCSENGISVCNVEREVFDTENANKVHDTITKKLAKKDRKRKKSKHVDVPGTEDSSCNVEVKDVSTAKEEKIENAELIDIPSKMNKMIHAIDSIIYSPSSTKARISKKILLSLFHNNAKSGFPDSNIHNIKGYDVDTS